MIHNATVAIQVTPVFAAPGRRRGPSARPEGRRRFAARLPAGKRAVDRGDIAKGEADCHIERIRLSKTVHLQPRQVLTS